MIVYFSVYLLVDGANRFIPIPSSMYLVVCMCMCIHVHIICEHMYKYRNTCVHICIHFTRIPHTHTSTDSIL